MTRVRIDPLAGRELADGADYYDERSPGLGDAFLDEFSRAIQQLSENPRSGPVIRGAIRRRPLLRFPYLCTIGSQRTRFRSSQLFISVEGRDTLRHVFVEHESGG